MMGFLSLGFSQPFVLMALFALPALWVVLRVNPPRPVSIFFPPLPLLAKLRTQQPEPRRLPLWLLIVRMLIAFAVVVAMAGPIFAPSQRVLTGSGPILLVMDSGWASANDWVIRVASAENILSEADAAGRSVAILASSTAEAPVLSSATAVRDRLRGLVPASFAVDRAGMLPKLRTFLATHSDAELVFVTDGLFRTRDQNVLPSLAEAVEGHRIVVIGGEAPALALAGIRNGLEGLFVRVVRADTADEQKGLVRAYDTKNRPIGEASFVFKTLSDSTDATFALPSELRNEISRIEIDGVRTAGAVALMDGESRRRKIGLVAGTSTDIAQPLLSPNWFVAQALKPFADLIEPRGGAGEAITKILESKASMLVLADIGNLPTDVEKQLADYVVQGGVLVRFAGPRMAAMRDTLMPVRIRSGDRALGGALSWESPKRLAPFSAESPFFGLDVPMEIAVTRQLLAEPDADLGHKTWAALSDGTPIVTAEKRGRGTLVLFHITADTSWSNLPISGLFVDILRKIVALSFATAERSQPIDSKAVAMPFRTMNGFGVLGAPSAGDKSAERATLVADRDHSAGFYGDPENPRALNVLNGSDTLRRIDFGALEAVQLPLLRAHAVDLRAALLVFAVVLFVIDTIATLILRGGMSLKARRLAKTLAALALLLLAGSLFSIQSAKAASIAPKDAEGPLLTHLAYIITGDATLDEASRAGLSSLALFMAERTALEPGEAVGVNLATDDLAVYPLLYWPMAPNQPVPNAASLAKIDAFMRDGGTMIFDTHDAALNLPGSNGTPETRMLRSVLAGLSVPDLEPVPTDHVLTKAFFLISRFPGRYAEGKTWIEALPKVSPDSEQPVRAGDGVSPIIITSNDLAAAWATDRNGEPLYPLTQSMPRQREMAMRAGANLVMYVLTGNYKADQVHVPALLERLGK